jgi:integrase
MKVALRERNQGKSISLFLDYYDKGKRVKKSLNIYLNPNPSSKPDKDLNKEKRRIAEIKRAEVELALIKGDLNLNSLNRKEFVSFFDFLQKEANKRSNNSNTYANWISLIRHFKLFQTTDIDLGVIDRNFISNFKDYIDKKARQLRSESQPLSSSTKHSYFNKFKAALKEAFQQELIEKDVNALVKGFPEAETERSYLAPSELQKLADSECSHPLLKQMFLFACITGMPFSDIRNLTMDQVRETEPGKFVYYFNRKKTNGSNYLPISTQAKEILDSVYKKNPNLFADINYNRLRNALTKWIPFERFNKKITFHCSRHTFATIHLMLGTDIVTLQKLMGHKNISTTLIYVKIVDKLKEDAVEKIKLENLILI